MERFWFSRAVERVADERLAAVLVDQAQHDLLVAVGELAVRRLRRVVQARAPDVVARVHVGLVQDFGHQKDELGLLERLALGALVEAAQHELDRGAARRGDPVVIGCI